MKVILLSDVKALGKRGDLTTVADGYANNFLLPRKLATRRRPARSSNSNSRPTPRSGVKPRKSPTRTTSPRSSRN